MEKQQFLSRKQLRKQKREDKKKKMDVFYKNRFNKNIVQQPIPQKQMNVRKQKGHSTRKSFHVKEQEDEEIESEEDENMNQSDNNELIEEEPEDDDMNEDQGDGSRGDNTELEKLDREIKRMEKKLGLKNEKKKHLFKKRLANENYDDDILDFLDHIGQVVKQEKGQKGKANDKKQKIVEEELEEDIVENDLEQEENFEEESKEKQQQETVPSLKDIKKQSKLFKNLDKGSELKLEFHKQLVGLLNKTTEGNIALIFEEYNRILDDYIPKIKDLSFFFEKITNVTTKLILEQDVVNMNITGCICSFISILHFKLGNNFFLYFIQSLLRGFQNAKAFLNINNEDHPEFSHNKQVFKNFIFIIIHFYIFGNLTSKIYFDLIKELIEEMNDVTSEMLLILLRHIGIEIRKENPEVIKEIVVLVNRKYNSLVAEEKFRIEGKKPAIENKKLKFIVEMIEDIKNNKFLKFNLLEKFSFLKTFATTNMKQFENSNSKVETFKLDLSLQEVRAFNLNSQTKASFISTDTNASNEIEVDEQMIDDANLIDTDKLNRMFKKYKINTDLKKKIFIAIVTAVDYLDAFEKLTRLNLNNEQSRDIIKIIVLLLIKEKAFNSFYFILLKKLISFNKDHKYTYHFTLWDQLKMMENFEMKSVHSLAKTTALLLNAEVIGLPCLLNFNFEESAEKQFLFILLIFDKYFESSNTDKTKILFAKLVKNDNHVEFGKKLFTYLLKTFVEDIDLEKKDETYKENYSAALRVLKKIL